MDKQRLGNFIADNRRAAGLTQRALAERLHVTDKAVSKWERALSYPDVTLLEPLAGELGLSVEELIACRRQENKKEEDPMRNLLEISRESLRNERRKHVLQMILALALMLAAVLGAIWYCSTYVRGQREDIIILKETVGNENYLYVEDKGHLLRLKCGEGVDFEGIEQTDERGEPFLYRLDCRWNRRSYEGTVSACEATGRTVIGSMMDATFEVESGQLFWYDEVSYTSENYYPDPYGEPRGQVFLCDYRFWTGEWDDKTFEWKDQKTVLLIEDCLKAVVDDIDQDGHNEVVVRTRWPEKPYMVYDWCNDFKVQEIDTFFPETVSPELREKLMTEREWYAREQEQMSRSLKDPTGNTCKAILLPGDQGL